MTGEEALASLRQDPAGEEMLAILRDQPRVAAECIRRLAERDRVQTFRESRDSTRPARIRAARRESAAEPFAEVSLAQPAAAAPVVNVYPTVHVPAQPAPTVNVAVEHPRTTRRVIRDEIGDIVELRDSPVE